MVLLVLLSTILYFNVRVSLIADSREEVRSAAALARGVLEQTGSPEAAARAREPGVWVIIRDSEGAVLAASPGAEDIPQLTSSARYPQVRRAGEYFATTFTSQRVSGATGEVYTTLTGAGPVLPRLLVAEIVGVAAALALVAGLGPALAARALRPLKRVSAVARELRRGELGSRVNLPELGSRRDEVGEVATSFDEMARSLEDLFEAERESKEAMRRFLADASHELRTPLTSVIGYLDVLIEKGKVDPAFRQKALTAMRDEAGRMARLVEDLLALARLDSRREGAREPVDLAALAREATGAYPERSIEVSALSPVLVLAQPDPLRRVVSNLLSNAVKYTPSDKNVRVSVKREDQEAVLRVADEGVGIRKEDLPYIFERFYQTGSSRKGEGTGLGLAIVKETVEALDGRIEVESVPDAGSVFTIHLPLSDKKQVPFSVF